MSVSRTHVAMASTEEDRPKAVSTMSITLTLGMVVGPALMVLLSQLGYPGYSLFGGLHLNSYTAPMYLILATTIVALVLLIFMFDGTMKVEEKIKKDVESFREKFMNTSFDKLAVFICCVTRMVNSIAMTFIATVGTPYSMAVFGWTNQQFLTIHSVMLTVVGLFGVIIR